MPALLPKSINVRESTLRAVKEEQGRGSLKRAREEEDHDLNDSRKRPVPYPVGIASTNFLACTRIVLEFEKWEKFFTVS